MKVKEWEKVKLNINVYLYLFQTPSHFQFTKTLNNWISEKVYLVICGRLLLICGTLLVVCGRFRVVCDRL